MDTKYFKVYPLEEVIGSLKAHEMQMTYMESDDEWPIYQSSMSSNVPCIRTKERRRWKRDHHRGMEKKSARAKEDHDVMQKSLGNCVSNLKFLLLKVLDDFDDL